MLSLVELFTADGHQLISAGEGEYKCLCPFHREKTPSCTIKTDTDKPFFHCFGCNAHGDDVDYLIRARGLSKVEAMRAARSSSTRPAAAPAQQKPAEWLAKVPARFTSRHVYRSAEGAVRFVIQRYDIYKDGQHRKLIVPYTRARKGNTLGWLKALAIDTDRPLYRLPELLASIDGSTVMVVEGEKCADAVAARAKRGVVVTWAGGTKAWRRTDLSPLHGRNLLLIADGDEQGRTCMLEIKNALEEHCRGIGLVFPPLAAPGQKARDIADEIADGTDLNAWIRQHTHNPAKPPAPVPPPAPGEVRLDRNHEGHFVVVDELPDGRLVFEIGTREVAYSRADLLQPGALLALEPNLEWWETVIAGGLFSGDLTLVVDRLYTLVEPR